MKNYIVLLVLAFDLVLIGIVNNTIIFSKEKYFSNVIADLVVENNYANDFYRDIKLSYVYDASSNIVNSKQDILNIIYTSLNRGLDFYDFKCDSSYESCYKDLMDVLNNSEDMKVINNLVDSFNSFKNYKLSYKYNGEFRFSIVKEYSKDDINVLNNRVKYIISKIISNDMSDEVKIRQVHNFLANNIKYAYTDMSDNAYGALIEGKAVCNGYADAFNIFLDKLEIPNYKVVSEDHIWNAVYVNNKWLHVDLTWDDINGIKYDYFLIDSNKLNIKDHNFNKKYYLELN